MIEIISLSKAIIEFDDKGMFIKGFCKAKELKKGGLKRQLDEAMKVRCL